MEVVSGVGLVLFDLIGRILLLKELKSKIHYCKVAGMLSVPIETIEEGESNDQALRRLIVEEIGVPIEAKPTFFKELMIKLNGTFTERLYVYTGMCEESFVARPTDTDIVYFGWMFPRQIMNLPLGQKRVEIEPILRSYLEQ